MSEVLRYIVSVYRPIKVEEFRVARDTEWLEGLLVAQHQKVQLVLMKGDIPV